jgi:hypothetical protein
MQSISVGIREGVRIGAKILLIMLPISFVVTLLEAVGLIEAVVRVLSPYGQYVGLYGASVLAYITGVLINCYSAIAIIITLSLSQKELTILALMLLLCHTLPLEVPIQKKAGASALLMLGVRVGSSLLAGALLHGLLHEESPGGVLPAVPMSSHSISLYDVLLHWGLTSVIAIVKLLLIVILFMIFHQVLERSGSLVKLSHMAAPLMHVLGLSEQVAFSWLIANVFGLIYGAGVIEAQKSRLRLDSIEQQALHLSLSTCHAVIQETLLFFAIGAPIIWLVAPRVLISFIVVWGYRLLIKLWKFRARRILTSEHQ